MQRVFSSIKNYVLLIFLLIGCIALLYYDVPSYLNFHTLKNYQTVAQRWTETHYFSALGIYFIIFIGLIACTIPCATIMTLIGGFLFGMVTIVYAEVATLIGGLILFFAVRTAIGHWIAERSSGWIKIMERGFKRNAFQYLILMRMVPVFPCWMSNVSAGALNVPVNTFIIATLIGIFPSTVIYTMVGRGLDTFLTSNGPPSWDILFLPELFFPLLGLIILTFLPIIYKAITKFKTKG